MLVVYRINYMQTCKLVTHIYFKRYSIFDHNNPDQQETHCYNLHILVFDECTLIIEDDEDLVGDIQNDDARVGGDEDDMDV